MKEEAGGDLRGPGLGQPPLVSSMPEEQPCGGSACDSSPTDPMVRDRASAVQDAFRWHMRTDRSAATQKRRGRTSTKPITAAISHDLYRHRRAHALLVAIAAAIGIALRIREYVANRALWLDESFLSLNIIDQSVTGLFGRLGFNQAAPPGFLVFERLAVEAFGRSEYALRLFPLICGIASIFLFLHIVRTLLTPVPQLIAMALFSVSEGLIYYSAEVKQYSTDVAASLLLLAAALALRSSLLPKWWAACWVVAGFAALALSYVAAFILIAVVIALVMPRALRRPWHDRRPLDLAVVLWLAGVAVALAYAHPRISDVVASYPSFPVGTQIRTAAGAVGTAVGYPAGGVTGSFKYVVALIGLAGFAVFVRRHREAAALVGVPALLLVFAAALHAYPILPRTVLFLLPFVAIVLAEGIGALASTMPSRRRLLVILLALAVCAVPATYAVKHFIAPQGREEVKPVLRYLAKNWRAGDSLFVFYRAQYALRYYVECGCGGLSSRSLTIPWGAATPDHFGSAQYAPALVSRTPALVIAKPQTSLRENLRQIDSLRGRRRVWLLATATGPTERQLLTYLSCAGRRTDVFVRNAGSAPFSTAAIYQYDLTRLGDVDALTSCRSSTPTRP
jgi:4-amino-4-deoxy-L-arabinose transferase-like glycosyltransferase